MPQPLVPLMRVAGEPILAGSTVAMVETTARYSTELTKMWFDSAIEHRSFQFKIVRGKNAEMRFFSLFSI